jgi:hypothetical protein
MIGVRIVRHPRDRDLQALLVDVVEDGETHCYAQVKWGEWVEYPEGGLIPEEAFRALV